MDLDPLHERKISMIGERKRKKLRKRFRKKKSYRDRETINCWRGIERSFVVQDPIPYPIS
jgi:hypothetical protein